jgi:riboflavin kinase/FMN adenylyltransferase
MKRVVVIGNFDGVHRGHHDLLAQAVETAGVHGAEVVVLTFFPHPAVVLGRPHPPVLTPLPRKNELLTALGARVHVEPFDRAFASLSPQEFCKSLLQERLQASQVYVGYNFRFGRGRQGDLTTLSALGDELGFSVAVHARVGDASGPWSSTRAREAIARGDMAEATLVLERPHALTGTVEHGRALGRTIGFATANLGNVEEMLPSLGVYAVLVDALDEAGKAQPLGGGVMNVGTRPTVSGGEPTVIPEVHLLQGAPDLYGQTLRVHLTHHIRAEQKFSGIDQLRAQIEKDRNTAAALLQAP